jgi:teichuronic acid biosynthesis glycosyltransferase TuaC
MKVLFISSGNTITGINTIIRIQGDSLIDAGVKLEYFPINGKGFSSYLKHIFTLRNKIKLERYDIFHAHYSLSALTATFAGCKPLVVSLMGSDTKMNNVLTMIIRYFSKYKWNALIVKSGSMKREIKIINSHVIPNGVDMKKVEPSYSRVNNNGVSTVLFASDPDRYSKNYKLAAKAIRLLEKYKVRLKIVHSVSHDEIIRELNCSNVLLLTSRYEGSPNIIKEAMACNIPIVTTDVGDVRYVIGNTEGCYITSFESEDVAEKIILALEYSGKKLKTNGRKRIVELGLDSETIAKKIINVYKEVITKQ